MSLAITAPCAGVQQISGRLPDQGHVLAVLAKRTYRIDARGRCALADEQLPLQQDVVYADDAQELVAADTDMVHFKAATDVVVLGHVHSRLPQTELGAGLRIGNVSKLVKVIGARRATLNSLGNVIFSPPQPFTKIPLTFALAYGGRDSHVEAKYGIPAAKFAEYLPPGFDVKRLSPYLYPRNPCGRGYLVEASREAVEALQLPQLEDAEDRLTPARLAAGTPLRWPTMPVPQSLGWLGHSWFPRSAFFGVLPEYEAPGRPIFEVSKGWVGADILQGGPPHTRFNLRATSGASLGLQLPYLKGNEDCALFNLNPSLPELRLKLPGEHPGIWTDGRKGKLNKTKPVIHSVVFEPDAMRVSVVWCGSAPALRPYLPDELTTMPLKVEW
jgi:hypothetical protein